MGKWSDDAFLDTLAKHSDTAADECVSALEATLPRADFGGVFAAMNSNDEPLPSMPERLRDFFDAGDRLPLIQGEPVSMERLDRGEAVFMTHALPGALVLLTKSLPEGYAAPRLSTILMLSGNLDHHPYRRLLGVLQMLVNVNAAHGFEANGRARVTASKMRLLHAGIRRLVERYLPDYGQRYGTPVSLEDMLGTIMGFSFLVLEGFRTLDIGLTKEEEEDYYYTWRVFAQMTGIHPPGQPDSSDYVPGSVAEAEEFYRSYARRHYRNADQNPEGVELTAANLRMLRDLMRRVPLMSPSSEIVPRICMEDLVGEAGCHRVNVEPVRGHFLLKRFLLHLPTVMGRIADLLDRDFGTRSVHERLSEVFFGDLIRRGRDGRVAFLIPAEFSDFRKLV
jgi:hypothetical protein